MIRPSLLVVAVVALAWHAPGLASANRSARQAKPAATSKVQVRAAGKTTSAARRADKPVTTQLKLRTAVRSQTKTTKSALSEGHMQKAAIESSRSPLRNAKGQFVAGPGKLSFRERFALWRVNTAVKRGALKMVAERSANGDLGGTADALNALAVLETRGKLGAFGRWQKARASKKAFRNIERSASRSLQRGDVEAAGQSYMFAADLRPGSRAARKMASKLIGESFKLAKSYAKTGQPQPAWSVLQMGAAIASEGGAKFNEKKAQKLVDTAFRNALPVLTANAQRAYKSGDLSQATALVAEARAIERNGNARPSASVARQQKRLVAKLGPSLTQFEAAQAEAAQAE